MGENEGAGECMSGGDCRVRVKKRATVGGGRDMGRIGVGGTRVVGERGWVIWGSGGFSMCDAAGRG